MRRACAIAVLTAAVLVAPPARPAGAVRVTTEVFLGDLNDVFFGAGEPLVFVIDPLAATVAIDEAATSLTALGQPIGFSLAAPIDFASGFYDGVGFIDAPQIGLQVVTDHADGEFVEFSPPALPIDPWDGVGVGGAVSLLMTAGCDEESGGALVYRPDGGPRPRHFIECGISLFLTAFVVAEDFGDIDCALAPDGARCDDGNVCTADDACTAGVCIAGARAACDDGDSCTVDSCEPASGCTHVGGDADGDAVCDDVDNCALRANPDQLDVDPPDGIGDACECRAPAPGVCVADGRGQQEGECVAELLVEPRPPISAGTGLPDSRVRCTDGDACDLDGSADGTCRVRISVCLNNRDPRTPACTPSATELVTLKRPSRLSKRSHEAAAADALVTSMTKLSSALVEGSRAERARFVPALAAPDACGPAVDVEVPIAGRKGRLKLSLQAEGTASGAARRDRDALKLFCLP